MKATALNQSEATKGADTDIGSTEGASKATGVEHKSGDRNRLHDVPLDPEVSEKKRRRKFTAKYKLRILAEADSCNEPGQLRALLRWEGLYSSNLTVWRRQREVGLLDALSPKKRGRKKKPKKPFSSQSCST